ncbi:MAG: class I SAM-dependent methyltransferase [Phycisphaeraceae bacterium]
MKIPMHFLYCYAYVAATVGWVMLSAPFYSPARSLVRRMAAATGWHGPATALPQQTLAALTPRTESVRVDNSIDHEFNTSFYELFVLSQLVADRKPARVFEFGTFNGRTTLHLAINTPPETRITTIDLPESESPFEDHAIVGSCYRGTDYADRIEQLYANTRRCDLSAYFGQMNFIFIDASHEYDDVLNDTDLALRLACPDDCMIVWHDYSQWPGVQQALEQYFVTGGVYANLQHIRGTTMAVLEMNASTHQPTSHAANASTPSPLGRGPG